MPSKSNRLQSLNFRRRAQAIFETQRVTDDVVAMGMIDRGFAQPTLAAQLTPDRGLSGSHSLGERFAQIEVAADAFTVGTIQAEHGLGVAGVDRVFNLAVSADAFGTEVSEIHGQGFQFRKLFGKGG